MSDSIIPIPVDAGLLPPPGASDPSTGTPPATGGAVTTQTPETDANRTPTGQAPSGDQTQDQDDEAAFKAIIDRDYGTGDKTKNPTTTTEPKAVPLAGSKEAPKPGDPPQAENQDKDAEPTEQERKAKLVPLDKLDRALLKRREAYAKAEAAEAALTEERKAIDQMVDQYAAIGVEPEDILPLLSELGAAGKGQPGALLKRYGISAPQATSQGIALADVEALLDQVTNAINPEPVVAAFKAKHSAPTAPPAPPGAALQPRTQEPPPPIRQAPALDRAAVVNFGVRQMESLETAEGRDFADKVAEATQPVFQAKLAELKALKVTVTTEVAKEAFRNAFNATLARERQTRQPPPTPARPSVTAPPAIDPNDEDAGIKAIFAKRYGRV